MDTGKTDNHRTCLWLALLASLVLHVVLFQLPGTRPSPPPDPASLDIDLVFVDVEKPDPDSEPPPRLEEEIEPEPETASPEQAPVEIIEATPESPSIVTPEMPTNQKFLRQVRINHSGLERPDTRNRLEGAPVPRLPSQPGWLSDYVGMVAASSDQWREADGAISSRVVMSDGRVICGRIRAPTTSEIFNPALSLAVPRFRICGRERPEPVDRTDPWVRGDGL